ncbi:MAG TPA: DUF5615 family PIN-like protein [Tepidiformaceae bacterium]|jgi:predicted nuclease of predicted toxin-antitoxin system|nr:DUF5615 family PIN-like protein [Tepidiformaceae bacterium]
MRLLIDENVPNSVSAFLRDRGHEVDLVRDRLGQMTPDEYIAWVGDELGAVVVTMDKDFNAIVKRVPPGGRAKFKSLGRISLKCRESQASARMREFIEEIEREYDRLQGRRDQRLIVEITASSYRIVR